MSEEASATAWDRIAPGITTLRTYRRELWRRDFAASLSLWAVLVPQALAYAELAGLKPAVGLYTALAGMVAYAIFGTSRYLNVGPESSVAIVVAATLAPLAGGDPARYAALAGLLALLVAGFLLVGFLVRAGVATRLLSAPVLTGYLAGTALVIIASQLPKIFGISLDHTGTFALVDLAKRIDETNWAAFAIGVGAGIVMVLIQRYASKLPAALFAIALATFAVVALHLDKEQGVDTVGRVSAGLPGLLNVSRFRWGDVRDLLLPAASIALLVFASSVATARTLAMRDGEDVDSNREFVGLSVANALAGALSGFPANGSDSRSFVLAGSHAKTQVAGLFGAALVVVTLFLLTPLIGDIPKAALGGVVLVTAVRLIDVEELRRLRRIRSADFVLALVTFSGVVVVGVLPGIGIGVLVSLADAMRRAIAPHRAVLGYVPGKMPTYRSIENYLEAETIPGLVVYRFDAPVFFANAEAFRADVLKLVRGSPTPVREFIVSAEAIVDVDTTGLAMLERLLDDLEKLGIRLVIARMRTAVRRRLQRAGLEERIGPENFHRTVVEAGRAFGARHGGVDLPDGLMP